MRICVIGAGALGGTFGARLAASGHDVTMVDHWAEHVAAIRSAGLRVDGVLGDQVVRVTAQTSVDGLRQQDLALVATDANGTAAAANAAAKVLGPRGVALTVQNGIGNVELLVERLGASRVIGGSTMASFRGNGPGWVTQTHAGPTTIGAVSDAGAADPASIAKALEAAGFEVQLSSAIMAVIWEKFLLNLAINPICAVTFLRLGEVARHPEVSAFQDNIMAEAFAVTAAKAVPVDIAAVRDRIKAHCRSKYSKPSMLQHMERGRRTEIDALNGALVREARTLGIPAPYNDALVALVKGCEAYHARRTQGVELDETALEAAAAAEAQISS